MFGWAGCFAVAFLVVPVAGDSVAQGSSPITRRDTYWLGAGLGGGNEGLAAQANASYQFGANLLSFRVATTAGLFSDESNDVGLLYGRATRAAGDRHLLAAALGVALVGGCRGGSVFSDCRSSSTVIGLPFELQLSWRPGKLVGLGLYGFANLNQTQSFAGVTLSVQAGRLR